MRTNRTRLAALLSIALAVVPAAAAAQSADEEPATPSHWTSTEISGDNWAVLPGGIVEYFDWGPRTTVGLNYTVEADDPRAAGDLNIAFVLDRSLALGMARGTGLARLVNEGGTFEGELHVVFYPDGSEFRMALLEGQDGYEGLSYTMTNFISPSGEGQTQGLIWEGEQPPLLEADTLPE